jgi:hypothetical protein
MLAFGVAMGMCVVRESQFSVRRKREYEVVEISPVLRVRRAIERLALVESELNFLVGRSVGRWQDSRQLRACNIQLCTHSQHAHDITCQRVLSLVVVSVRFVCCTAV